ncbi:unnamed protein product [Ectocarpus sp. CCAP 1310/34]|nr:unnamed protein product [Ectocarpus sp. CCAP 1310/34]
MQANNTRSRVRFVLTIDGFQRHGSSIVPAPAFRACPQNS